MTSGALETSNAVMNATEVVGGAQNAGEWPSLPANYFQERWYVVYTSANHEKPVAQQLGLRAVEHFLPVYESVRRWKDRRVTLQLPLFPGYLFVRMALRNRLPLLQTPGVVRLVGFDGTPAVLPDEEVEALQRSLKKNVRAEPHPFLRVGRRVRVKSGPLAGLQGIMTRRRSPSRLVVSVELIQRSIALEIDEADVEVSDNKRIS